MEASQEAALEDLLDRISSKWNSIDFTVAPFKDVKDTFILGSVEDVTAALEDSMVTMSSILASRQVHLPAALHQNSNVPHLCLGLHGTHNLAEESQSHHHSFL